MKKVISKIKQRLQARAPARMTAGDELVLLTTQLADLHARHAEMETRFEEHVRNRTRELSRSNQRLQAANQQLESFNYMVSHDLRASLRSLDGFLDVLMEDMGPQQTELVQRDLKHLHDGIDLLRAMVNELLKLARGAHSELQCRTVDLSMLCHEIAAELRMYDPERRVDIDIAEGLTVKADPVLIREVLYNLLANAWKFTSRRTRARIQFGVQHELGNAAYFVRDNGAGFDMRRREELFQPFHRLHDQEEFAGTGVGLATASRIVERHGGRIWAHGTPDQGAKFSFTLHENVECCTSFGEDSHAAA